MLQTPTRFSRIHFPLTLSKRLNAYSAHSLSRHSLSHLHPSLNFAHKTKQGHWGRWISMIFQSAPISSCPHTSYHPQGLMCRVNAAKPPPRIDFFSTISGVGHEDGHVTRWAVRVQFSAKVVSVARAEMDLAE
jgi:hypothetical protein